ncbi:MAG: FAD:protein FMN transferase, partial [Anaerolineae bacterium]|nr:FAD:protein FMN transferase [Anaerolineae bacterium]
MIHLIEFHAMGCQVSVQLEAGSMGGAILSQIPEQMAAIEARLTRFKPDSELMQLNACDGEWMQVSDVLYENISAAKHAALLTDGLYNPLILPALIASGYDRSFEQIETAGSASPTPVSDWHGIDLRRDTHEVCIPEG